MCGRYSFTDPSDVRERFNIQAVLPELEPRYNIAPTQNVPVVIQDGTNHLALFKWGLIPHWSKDPRLGSKMINARVETVDEKPSFKHILTRQRCLVPADGFYEWMKQGTGKYPFRITLKNGGLFAFAGLWDSWISPGGETIRSFTIITTEANELVGAFHDRMPVILSREAENTWLDPNCHDTSLIKNLLQPYPAGRMTAYRVAPAINSPKNDCQECILPLKS